MLSKYKLKYNETIFFDIDTTNLKRKDIIKINGCYCEIMHIYKNKNMIKVKGYVG